MAANWSTLNMPRFEMVKVPPLMSSPDSLPSLACTSTARVRQLGVMASGSK